MLNLFSDSHLLLLHGIKKCDSSHTFFGPQGSSAVDFILCPLNQFPELEHCKHHSVERTTSDHDLVIATFRADTGADQQPKTNTFLKKKPIRSRLRSRSKTTPKTTKKMFRETVRDHKDELNQHFALLLDDASNIIAEQQQQHYDPVERANHKLHSLIVVCLKDMVEKYGVTPSKTKTYFNAEVSRLARMRSKIMRRMKSERLSTESLALMKSVCNHLKDKSRALVRSDLTQKRAEIGHNLERDRIKNPALFWVKIEKLVASSVNLPSRGVPEFVRNDEGDLEAIWSPEKKPQ